MESKSSMRSLLVCKQIPERKFQFTEWFNKNVNRCDLIEIKLVLRYLEQFNVSNSHTVIQSSPNFEMRNLASTETGS